MTPEEFRESAARAIEANRETVMVVSVDDFDRGFVAAMTLSAEIVRSHPVASPWIAVGERLPEDRQTVAFVVAKKCQGLDPGRVLGGRYMAEAWGGFGIPGLGGIPASHWMPLPEPPTEPAS